MASDGVGVGDPIPEEFTPLAPLPLVLVGDTGNRNLSVQTINPVLQAGVTFYPLDPSYGQGFINAYFKRLSTRQDPDNSVPVSGYPLLLEICEPLRLNLGYYTSGKSTPGTASGPASVSGQDWSYDDTFPVSQCRSINIPGDSWMLMVIPGEYEFDQYGNRTPTPESVDLAALAAPFSASGSVASVQTSLTFQDGQTLSVYDLIGFPSEINVSGKVHVPIGRSNPTAVAFVLLIGDRGAFPSIADGIYDGVTYSSVLGDYFPVA